MFLRTFSRRILLLSFSACFLLNTFAVSSSAHRRERPNVSKATAQTVLPRKRLEGPANLPPARTYDVLHYLIRTRFDVPNKTVIGDETITLKPLASRFNSFALDAADMRVESVTLAQSNLALQW